MPTGPFVWREPSQAEPISSTAAILRCAIGDESCNADMITKWIEDPDLAQIGHALLYIYATLKEHRSDPWAAELLAWLDSIDAKTKEQLRAEGLYP